MLNWVLNLNVTSPNRVKHWGVIAKNNKRNKAILSCQWLMEGTKIKPPCVITIQRLYNPSKFEKRWDDDNWIAGCKGIRDTLASFLVPDLSPGQADNPKYGIKFQYDQITSSQKGVRIIIEYLENQNGKKIS